MGILKFSLLVLLSFGFCGFGCRKPIENPHLHDPVYISLTENYAATGVKIEAAKKDLEKAKQSYETAPLHTGMKQEARDSYFEIEKKIQILSESQRYLRIKIETRKKDDEISYAEAFKNMKEWPDPVEVSEAAAEDRLKKAPKDWDPKARMKPPEPVAKPAGEGHGE